MIVVIGESGEYEQRSETLFGIFDALDAAEAAVTAAISAEPADTKAWYAWDARRKEALDKFEPERVLSGYPFKSPFKCYKNEQYEEAKRIAGVEPEPFGCDTIYYYDVEIGRLEHRGWNAIKEVGVRGESVRP